VPDWEYTWWAKSEKELGDAMSSASGQANEWGRQGWEMVNYTVQSISLDEGFAHTVTCFFKRPVVHEEPRRVTARG
jgi:hypothetical protein